MQVAVAVVYAEAGAERIKIVACAGEFFFRQLQGVYQGKAFA